LRENLRRALQLLAEAGWTVQNGQLKNAKGERLVIELLDSSEAGSRTHSAFVRNLAKLGIELRMRIVDFALYQQRLDQFDYDMIVINFQGTHTPGQEYLEIFGSKAADTEGSGNYAGVKNPAVDTLVRTMVGAQTKAELLPACRALERVIAHSHYLIPQWNSTHYNVAYSAEKLAKPEAVPPYARAENWLMSTWWSRYPVPLLNLK
jgi:microcin C transport system substrate-binding protein